MKKLQVTSYKLQVTNLRSFSFSAFLLFCFIFSSFSLNAQQFPSSSFEDQDENGTYWKYVGETGRKYWEYKTEYFYTLNEIYNLEKQATLTAFKDTKTAQHGNNCIKLVSGHVIVFDDIIFLPGLVGTLDENFVNEFLYGGGKITYRHDWDGYRTPSALEGWYKYRPVAGDSALIEIGFYKRGNNVMENPDVCERIIIRNATDTTVNGWQRFSIPIPEKYWYEEYAYIRTLFIASADVNFENLKLCKGSEGSTLWIDNISLKYPGDGITQNLLSTLKAHLFPNPASEVLNIELNEEFYGKIVVYNMNGSKMLEEKIIGTTHQLNISELATGNYVYRLMKENTVLAQGKFVVTK